MIRKDKIHIVLLVCAVILCLAANGSVSSDELGQMHSSLAGTTALADGPPETETDEVSQEVNTAADPAESAEPDNYVPLYINGVLDSECLVIDGIAHEPWTLRCAGRLGIRWTCHRRHYAGGI